MNTKNLYIIAGCNGAGKTTASYSILPEILNCKEFVNADEIAKGLSPFQPETVAIEAGRIMLNRINDLLAKNKSFAFETTLATRSYVQKIKIAQAQGYHVTLLFFWLQNVEIAQERVKIRVQEGGHNIPDDVIKRRYISGIKNLFDLYLPIVDSGIIFDNTENDNETIAKKIINTPIKIINPTKFNLISNIKIDNTTNNNINDLQTKITEAMKQVRLDLIAYKTKMNSPLVIMQDGKIVHISAEEYAKLPVKNNTP